MHSQPPNDDLVQRVLDDDKQAIAELLALQQQGKMLRRYPRGRLGPNDDGLVAYGVYLQLTTNRPPTVVFQCGVKTEIFEFTLKAGLEFCAKMQAELATLLTAGLVQWSTAARPARVALAPGNDIFYVQMPSIAHEWELSFNDAMLICSAIDQLVDGLYEASNHAERKALRSAIRSTRNPQS